VPRPNSQLTDDEATFLALLVRVQPATAYQLSKIYADSPISNFGTSKGKIYPMIRRLKERGLVGGKMIAGDARKIEILRSTTKGRDALRRWVRQVKPNHLLPEDPLRTMVQSFELLSREERLQWIDDVRSGLRLKLAELEEYGAAVQVPYKDQVHDNAVSSIEGRLDWLDRLENSVRRAGEVREIAQARTSRG
jgi:DNA-binding PadR family transcriptional regulator